MFSTIIIDVITAITSGHTIKSGLITISLDLTITIVPNTIITVAIITISPVRMAAFAAILFSQAHRRIPQPLVIRGGTADRLGGFAKT